MRDGQIIAPRKSAPKRAVSGEYLDLNPFGIYALKPGSVAIKNIMQVYARTGFTEFRIGRRKFGSRFKIQLFILFSTFILQIKINYNMIFREPHVMHFRSVHIRKLRFYVCPFLIRDSVLVSILCRAILQNIIQR